MKIADMAAASTASSTPTPANEPQYPWLFVGIVALIALVWLIVGPKEKWERRIVIATMIVAATTFVVYYLSG